jgi:uncharacterized protein YecE (DUF72 family)
MVRQVRVGCCGFPMARGRYFERFPVVEVQQTFYEPPRPETLARWRERAPEAFEFTLKAWQLVTHEPTSPTYRKLREPIPEPHRSRYGSFRPTGEVRAAWLRTLEAAHTLRARIVVFRCPASFGPDEEHLDNLRRFFSAARRDAPDLTFGWEPRGRWPDHTVSGLCRELGLLLVVDPFQRPPAAGGPNYFRLHGLGGYRHRNSDAELRQLLQWCGRPTCCLFRYLGSLTDPLKVHHPIRLGPAPLLALWWHVRVCSATLPNSP